MKHISLRNIACGIAAVVLSFALPACTKSGGSNNSSSNGNGYYLKFKLDGVKVEYDSQPIAQLTFIKADSLYSCVLAAYKDVNAGMKNALVVTLFTNSPFTAGASYNDPAKATSANGNIAAANTIFYYDSAANGYLTMGAGTDSNGNIPLPGVVADARLTITEMTSAYLKGTFSGTVYKTSDFNKYYAITEGEFYLRRTD